MKKFYALALAAFALTASAQSLQVVDLDLNPIKAKATNMVRPEARVKAASVLTPTAAPTIDDIAGLYIWECYEMMTDQSGAEVGESSYPTTINVLEDNEVEIVMDYGTFTGTFDPATGNISIPVPQESPIVLGGQEYVAYLEHAIWPAGQENPEDSAEPIVLTYVNGMYEAGADDFISVAAVIDDEIDGYFHFAMDNLFSKYAEEIPEGWTSMGVFNYQDSWAINLFDVDAADWQYMVTVIKSDEDENVIRILNPYTNIFCPIRELNNNTEAGGMIELNIGNPDFIWLTGGLNSGFSYLRAELEDMTCWNLEGYLKHNNPNATDEAIIENFETNEVDVSTMVDDVITVRNTVFGFTGAEYGTYSWQNNSGQSVMTDAILWLGDAQSGINNVVADNDNNVNAPVVYYNLQGVQVANPAAGIFIRKQGNKTTKVIVK